MEHSSLEKIHPKFKNEHQCFSCCGYFLDENKDAVQCKRCIKDGRMSPIENAKDVLHKDVNVTELSKKVAELEASIEILTKDKTPEDSKEIDAKPINPVKKKVDGNTEEKIGEKIEQTDVLKVHASSVDQNPKVYKDKKCSKCDNYFTPGASAQKICHSCREALIT